MGKLRYDAAEESSVNLRKGVSRRDCSGSRKCFGLKMSVGCWLFGEQDQGVWVGRGW